MHKSYFQSGDGSKGAPFEIANPTQLYYFSWLQYLGYFNQKDENGYIAPFYFIVSKDLDMKGLYLPPIGTMDYPFLGSFDGAGHTISNLTIQNNYDKQLLEPPNNTESLEGVEIIGFFGVVGSLEGETSYTYDTEANQISNFVLENLTVETQTKQALIGLVAGYVNGPVNKVGVVGSTVNIKEGPTALSYTDNISDYTLIGYCADNYKGKLYSLDLYLYDPNTETYQVIPENSSGSNGTGWGGSVKMKDIYGWLDDVNDAAQSTGNPNTNYYVSRVDVIGLGENAKPVTNTSLSEVASKPSYTITEATSEHKFGTFVFGYTMGSMGSTDVNFVGGGQKVTEYRYTDTDTQVPRYYIKNDNNQYITFDGTIINTSSNEANATKWYKTVKSGKDVFFTVYNNNVYYLTSSGSSFSVVSANSVDHEELPSFSGSNNTYVMVPAGKKIKAGNTSNYLNVSGTSIANTTDANSAVNWSINQVGGGYTISTTIDGTTYYLRHQSNWFNIALNLVTTTNQDTTWQYTTSGTTHTFSFSTTGFNSGTYELRYDNNNGWTLINTNNNNNTGTRPTVVDAPEVSFSTTQVTVGGQVEYVKNVEFTKDEYIDDSIDNRYYNANGDEQVTGVGVTYFPLSSSVTTTNGNTIYSTNSGNTGYIIGAGWGIIDPENDIEERDDNDSNIRISQYGNSITNADTPLTMTFRNYQSGAFQSAPQLPTDETPLTTEQLQAITNLGLFKYANCYSKYRTSITTYCYGLHFMKASVSESNTTRIDAYLNGEWIDNYEVPLNCIDFNLYERGFINFVAGSYYTNNGGNDSFFSIYEIFRDGKDITGIKEIYKIYGDVDTKTNQINTASEDDYIYTYVAYDNNGNKYEVDAEGNRVTGGIAGKTMIFDCDWITNPTEYISANQFNNKSFYFEVPVNEGEYAIGSTKDKTGAYLIYLDLAANAQIVERTRVDEKSYVEETEMEFPKGVSILEKVDPQKGYNTSNINPENSAFISIGTGNTGASLTQNGSVITDGGTGHTAVYIDSDLQLVDANGKPMTVPISKTMLIEQSTYYDYNVVTHFDTVTVIKKITVVEGGETTINYTKTVIVTDEDGNPALDEEGNPLSKDEEVSSEPLLPDVPDEGKTPTYSDNQILGMKYIVTDPETMTLDHSYTETVNEENVVTDKVYVLTLTNTGEGTVPVYITLTQFGVSKNIRFTVVTVETPNGEDLKNDQTEQEVEVPVQDTATETP